MFEDTRVADALITTFEASKDSGAAKILEERTPVADRAQKARSTNLCR